MSTKNATISILVNDRETNVGEVNTLLTKFGPSISARLGVNVDKVCVDGCPGLIVVALKDDEDRVRELTEALGALEGVEAKECVFG